MMPPVGQWGRIIKDGKDWVKRPVQIVRLENGRFTLDTQHGRMGGSFEIVQKHDGFKIKTKHGGTSSLCAWQPA